MGIVFGVVFLALVVVLGVLRCGVLFPRFGRWLDARIYRMLPRAGHLFMSEDETRAQEHRQASSDGSRGARGR